MGRWATLQSIRDFRTQKKDTVPRLSKAEKNQSNASDCGSKLGRLTVGRLCCLPGWIEIAPNFNNLKQGLLNIPSKLLKSHIHTQLNFSTAITSDPCVLDCQVFKDASCASFGKIRRQTCLWDRQVTLISPWLSELILSYAPIFCAVYRLSWVHQ